MSQRFVRRYEDEQTAIEAARRYSVADRTNEYHVLESPHQEAPDAGRFVVDTDGSFVRSWEREVCTFIRGSRIK